MGVLYGDPAPVDDGEEVQIATFQTGAHAAKHSGAVSVTADVDDHPLVAGPGLIFVVCAAAGMKPEGREEKTIKASILTNGPFDENVERPSL